MKQNREGWYIPPNPSLTDLLTPARSHFLQFLQSHEKIQPDVGGNIQTEPYDRNFTFNQLYECVFS